MQNLILIPFPAHASTKQFFVSHYEGKKVLVIKFPNEEEKVEFEKITNLLLKKGICVPQVIASLNGCLLITEFIDGIHLSKLNDVNFNIKEKILKEIEKFALIKHDELEGISLRYLNYKRMKYEMDFFVYHFCKSFLNLFIKQSVVDKLYKLIEEVDSLSKRFSHRDYHSENIIVCEEEVYIVDYQDALFAPSCYDYSSLFVDGYREFGPDFKNMILRKCFENIKLSFLDFKKVTLERVLKALGTFGYQVLRRKKIKYLNSIKRSVRYFPEILDEKDLIDDRLKDFLFEILKKVTLELYD